MNDFTTGPAPLHIRVLVLTYDVELLFAERHSTCWLDDQGEALDSRVLAWCHEPAYDYKQLIEEVRK